MMATLSEYYKYYHTTNATAEARHVKSGKTAYLPEGKVTGAGYFPACMQFGGSPDRYIDTAGFSVSSTTFSMVIQLKIASFTGASAGYRPFHISVTSGLYINMNVYSSDFTTAALRNKVAISMRNSADTTIINLVSLPDFADDSWHSLLFAYNGSTADFKFVIDNADADDIGHSERITPVTGTFGTTSPQLGVGASTTSAGYLIGYLGCVGAVNNFDLIWSDIFESDGAVKNIESTISTAFHGTPIIWHESGDLTNNRGSSGAFTKNGSPVLAPPSVWS